MTIESQPTSSDPLADAIAHLERYDDLIRHAPDDLDRAELQRGRLRAAVRVLRTAVNITNGGVPPRVERPLRQVEAACNDREAPLPPWLDPESFVGTAVVVGLAVLATTAGAPLGAAVVSEPILKETLKTAVAAVVASALTEVGNRGLKEIREEYLHQPGAHHEIAPGGQDSEQADPPRISKRLTDVGPQVTARPRASVPSDPDQERPAPSALGIWAEQTKDESIIDVDASQTVGPVDLDDLGHEPDNSRIDQEP
jgi:hypothetical protein